MPAAQNKGTRIDVRDLFYATPARLKFLKSSASETAQCADILNRKAAFGDKEKAEKAAMAKEILEHGIRIAESDYTFVTKLGRK